MSWKALSTIFFLSMIKFMFAPFTGVGLSLSFVETALACFIGAVLSSAFFYFSSKYFMEKARYKRMNSPPKKLSASAVKRKRKVNKIIVQLKRKLGIYGICFFGPLLLSIPLGTIICAKFYNHQSKTFPLIVLCLGINSIVLSALAVLIF
ncbi:MAG: hypothetical protein KJ941_10030 [Bacteroidetes bacterium]|nr:hypothetical protein [Bacteroidota bacterium]